MKHTSSLKIKRSFIHAVGRSLKTVTPKRIMIFSLAISLLTPFLSALRIEAAGQYAWTTNNQPSEIPVEARYWNDLDYSNDGTVAYGTATGNVFKSADNGVNWQRMSSFPSGSKINGITVSADGMKIFAYGTVPTAAAGSNGSTILKSTDGGISWSIAYSPSGVYFNDITSSDDGEKVAALQVNNHIYTSEDAGASWVERSSAGTHQWWSLTTNSSGSLLVAVVLGDTDQALGNVYTSSDFGLTWTAQTTPTSAYWSSVASASSGQKLVASSGGLSYTGYLYTSDDYGVTWTAKTEAGKRQWQDVAISDDGQTIVAVASVQSNNTTNNVYISSDFGATWSAPQTPITKDWRNVALSGDGSKVITAQFAGAIFSSGDSGQTWTKRLTPGAQDWTGLTSSSDNNFLAASTRNDYIYTSSNGGSVWDPQEASGLRDWSSITSSDDGKYLAATVDGGHIVTSSDWGVTWTDRSTGGYGKYWRSINSNSSGSTLIAIAGASYGYIFTSNDYGVTWTAQTVPGVRGWYDGWVSDDGSKMVAVTADSYMAISYDTGATWELKNIPSFNNMHKVTASSDLSSIYVVIAGYNFYKSTDQGTTWNSLGYSSAIVSELVASSDGTMLAAADDGGGVSFSRNSGVNWTRNVLGEQKNKASVAVSDDFSKTALVVQYTSPVYTANYYDGPSVPQNLVAAANNAGEVNLSWQEPSSSGSGQIVSYKVSYKKNTDSTWTNVDGITALNHQLTGLEAGLSYQILVTAVNNYISGESAYVSVSIPLPPLPPRQARALDQPRSINVDTIAGTSVVSWDPVDNKYGGAEWEKDVNLAPWGPRYAHTLTAFKDKLWVIGGRGDTGNQDDVWSSSDGLNWTEEVADAPWQERSWHDTIVFNDKMWIIGGSGMNDVWSSPDGVNWTEEVNEAPWFGREAHQAAVFNDKIWVAGSWDYTSDIWSSPDGVNWTEETSSAPWAGRAMFTMESFGGKLWVIGGETDATDSWLIDDIWSSSDGVSWTREVEHAPWGERGWHTTTVFDDKLWVMGGYKGMNWDYMNDVWSSPDGVNWTQVTEQAGWQPREEHATAVLGNRMFVTGGYTQYSGQDPRAADVWSTVSDVVSHYKVCWDNNKNGCTNYAEISPTGKVINTNVSSSLLSNIGQALFPSAYAATHTSQLSFKLPTKLSGGSWYFSVTAIYQGIEEDDHTLGAVTNLYVAPGLPDTGVLKILPYSLTTAALAGAVAFITRRTRKATR